MPRQPWIPFSAAKRLDRILSKESIVWEVGSGYSTLWLSDRALRVTSIEASEDWYRILKAMLEKENISNVDLRFEWIANRMSDFRDVEDHSLDLLFVDGGPRGACLANGFCKVRSGGYIYLDNWDNQHLWEDQRDFPVRHGPLLREIISYVDYVPAQFGVYEGLLLRKI